LHSVPALAGILYVAGVSFALMFSLLLFSMLIFHDVVDVTHKKYRLPLNAQLSQIYIRK
jgi:hypothetical protein